MDLQQKVTVSQLPKRNKGDYSKKFEKVKIITNFYPVDIKPIDQIHIFKIKFSPQITLDDRTTRQRLLSEATSQIKPFIHNPIFSGFNIYSLSQPVKKQFSIKTQTHQISIKQVKVLKVKQNNKILLHFLNNGLRNMMTKLKYVEIGRSGKYFNPGVVKKFEKVMMFSGFKANFMQLQKGIYLRVDTAKKIVRNQTALQYIDEIIREHGGKSRDERREILKQQFINKTIMTNYGKARYLKIIDLQFVDIDETLITDKNISIRQYYQEKYELKIQNSKQPMFVVEQKRRKDQKVYIVPELCLMTGIPEDFDERKRKQISQETIRSASQRKNQIGELMNVMIKNGQLNPLEQMGIKVEQNMYNFQAKKIKAPKLALGDGQTIPHGRQSNFQLFGQPIFSCNYSLKISIISFKNFPLHELMDLFEQTSRKLEVKTTLNKISAGEYDGRRSIDAIEECIRKAKKQEQKGDCNMVLIIIPNQLKSHYKKIKQMCLIENGLVCQIATQSISNNRNFKSVATKILLQIIAKRGNTLWVPNTATQHKGLMLVAFDTAKMNGKNVMAGVAAINSTFSTMCSRIEEYTDVNNKLHTKMIVLLKLVDAYIKRNNKLPKQIIIFSNSCPGDQITAYKQFMINPTISKMEELYGANRPNLTVTLVNTKTAQRFFFQKTITERDDRYAGKVGDICTVNVPAGTIVSQNIVSNDYDFFLVSQFASRGSTVPNHYRVIHNDSKMEEGVLQELIYSQCFNYVNWTGSIKVPGILQYAKKCVRFCTEVLDNRTLNEEIESKLYYI